MSSQPGFVVAGGRLARGAPPAAAGGGGVPATRRPRVTMMAKPKRGKARVVEDESNAVDVFGGAAAGGGDAGADPGDLLAQALADAGPAAGKGKKGKKKAAGVVDDESNAVDVFGGAADGAEEGDLLAAAMAGAGAPAGKKAKKKGKKKGVASGDDNAVDVFGSGDADDGGDLLAAALADAGPAVRSGKKGKKKGNAKQAKDSVPRGVVAEDAEELLAKALADTELSSTGKDQDVKAGAFEDSPAGATVGSALQSDEEEGDESAADVEVEDAFEPDEEVASEFAAFSDSVLDFTLAGRRSTARASRDVRNASAAAEVAAAEEKLAVDNAAAAAVAAADAAAAEAKREKKSQRNMGDARRANYGSGGEKFTSVRLEDVTVTFRNTTVLSGVTWGVKTGDRIGLCGQNGCGKTTQLKLMAGQLEPTTGEVVRSSARTRASFLRQEFVDELDLTRTLREELLSSLVEEQKALSSYQTIEKEIEKAGDDLEKLDVLLNQLEAQREKCDALGAWNLDSRIDKVMPGLGFVEDDNDKLVASFSGGWKVRIGIGKVLLQDPDLLLLDEPSNHLDLESVEWLEEYLQNCDLPMVIVSHDREFLNRVCNKIVHVEGGEAYEYPGNYSRFVKMRAERRKAWEAAYEKQSRFLTEQRNYIKRNRMSAARSKQVKSRQKMLDRMERTGQLVRQPPRGGKPLVFRFPPAPRSGRDVVVMEDVTHGYEGKVLFRDASIAIERGDRMALIGPNGCGKSSLLRLIAGREAPQSGSIQCQELHNVKLAYFEQNQADALDLSVTVLDTLKRAAPEEITYEEIRALLGKFLFKGDSVEKKVEALSGGEKARLALAKMMLEPANLMVLDEPTNHIDAAAMDMLEEALQHYDGTLLVVSHDRYFVSQVAKQILYIEDEELKLHDGDYKSYMEKDKRIKALAEARFVEGTDGIKSAPDITIAEEAFDAMEKKKKRKKNFGGAGVASGGPTKGLKNAKRWNR